MTALVQPPQVRRFDACASAASLFLQPNLDPDGGSSDTTTEAVVDVVAPVVDDGTNIDPAESSSDYTTDAEESPPRNLTFSATKPYDGSLDDADGIPSRFLRMKRGDRERAKERFAATLAWREEFEVDTLLSRPHPQYDVCKAVVPHYFSGRDPHGNVVFVHRPALLDFELMKKNNATIEDLLMHYIFVVEYCWNILEEGPAEGVMTSVLDMRGSSFRNMMNQEYIGFGKRFVSMMSSHYPGRSNKILVVNAPKWFQALYKIFKPMLRETTRGKIKILQEGRKQDEALRSTLGDSLPLDLLSDTAQEGHARGARYFIPVEDREESSPGPNSLIEFDMRELVIEQLKLHNETLQEVLRWQ